MSEIFEHKQIVEKVETSSLLRKPQFVIYRTFDPPLFPGPHLFNIPFYGVILMIPEPRLAKDNKRLCELHIIQQLFMVNIPALDTAAQYVRTQSIGTQP